MKYALVSWSVSTIAGMGDVGSLESQFRANHRFEEAGDKK
jgi:hypothetical protein